MKTLQTGQRETIKLGQWFACLQI